MSSFVRTFRRTVVEGRFVSFPVALVIIGMRVLLFSQAKDRPISYPDSSHLWQYLAPFFSDPVVSLAASTLSVLLIARLIHSMNNRFALIRTRSNLPFMVPLFLLSLHPRFLVMSADLVAVIGVLLAFFPLLQSYQKQEAYLCSFRSAILIAFASLFHIGALALVPLWWRGERSMRGSQWRALLTFLFGILLVYLSLFSVHFLQDDVYGFLQPFRFFSAFSVPLLPDYSITEWIAVLFVALFFISNMILSTRTYSRDKVLTLKLMRFVVYLVVFLLLLQVIYWSRTLFFLTLAIALISYLNAYYFTRTNARSDGWLASLNIVVMLLFYLSHFDPFHAFLS
ncbi:MAG: hypothetical protein PHS71_01650 [Proteiniphilum sp.]|nr:hypothetical protein [Proteiniphilum sp.]MDD4799962.1 hypothetical protein [Proteiniphilum sp.]